MWNLSVRCTAEHVRIFLTEMRIKGQQEQLKFKQYPNQGNWTLDRMKLELEACSFPYGPTFGKKKSRKTKFWTPSTKGWISSKLYRQYVRTSVLKWSIGLHAQIPEHISKNLILKTKEKKNNFSLLIGSVTDKSSRRWLSMLIVFA